MAIEQKNTSMPAKQLHLSLTERSRFCVGENAKARLKPGLGGVQRGQNQSPSCLLMISFITSRVPPPMDRMRLSRYSRSTRLSRIKPMPPRICVAS